MKGVVLAGGTGSRMSPLTKVTNKHLLPVYDEPMIYKPIKTLINSGITDIMIILGGESVGDFVKLLGSGSEFGANFTYRYQDKAGGIAEALQLSPDFVGKESVAVILGDNIFSGEFTNIFIDFERDKNKDCYLFLKEVDNPERFGVAEISGDIDYIKRKLEYPTDVVHTDILSIEEKPKNPKSNFCVTGLYLFRSNVFQKIKTLEYSDRGELEITDVNNMYVKEGKVRGIILNTFWSDAGTFETLIKCSDFYSRLL